MSTLSQTWTRSRTNELSALRSVIPDEQGRVEPLVFSALGLSVALAGSVYLVFYLHYDFGDAWTRVLNAYYTLFSPKFHLAAIGFVWNPLPSLVELPLLFFRHWFPWLLTQGFAGNIMSSVSSAFSVYFFNRILYHIDVPRFWRGVFTVIFMLNPIILIYSSSGMSEAMMIATMLGALSGALGYLRTERTGDLISAGLWLAVCFGARYEAVPYGLAIGLAFFIALLVNRYSAQQIQANLILAGLPLIFAGLLWVLLNWMIMGDPLYFMHSSYSNAAQIATGSYNDALVLRDKGHLLYSLMSVSHFTVLFPPVVLGIAGALLLLLFSRRHRATSALLLAATLAIPLFQVVMIDKHASAMWARFFIMYVPTGILTLAYTVVVWTSGNRWIRHIVLALATVLFIAGSYATLIELQSPIWGRGLYTLMPSIVANKPVSQGVTTNDVIQGQVVAKYINEHPNMIVLLDTFDSYGVIPYIKRPKQVVITSDLDFESILLNPRGRVTDFLVPSATGIGSLDAITQTYPGISQGKVSWAKKSKSFPGQRHYILFKIGPTAP